MVDYFTTVRPDVFREIENRGKKSDAVGVQVGWGTNADTMVLQKSRLKTLDNPTMYEKLLKEIVPLGTIGKTSKKAESPPKRKKRKGQYESEITTKWFIYCKKNEAFFVQDMTLEEFIHSPAGEALQSYTEFLKNKL